MLGSNITIITTNSAYKIKSHVKTAHIIPQISWNKVTMVNIYVSHNNFKLMYFFHSTCMHKYRCYKCDSMWKINMHLPPYAKKMLKTFKRNYSFYRNEITLMHQALPPQQRLCISLSGLVKTWHSESIWYLLSISSSSELS